ncbi:MAG TPA: hypothetical protein VNI83_00310 [Vicinamibacterales bacterium]|nr:hypothetical protein [Vicinamibacterales bacterium]
MAVGLLWLLGTPAGTRAQTPSPAETPTAIEVLGFLLTNQAVVTGDFTRDRTAAEMTRDTLTRALGVALATQPLTSSSSGFAYRFNAELGTFERVSESFGPAFVERAHTAGPGQATVGMTLRYARFDRLDGRSLRDGSLVTVANRFRDEPEAFDVERLILRLQTLTLTPAVNVALSERVEVSAALPIVALELEGERTNVYRGQTFLQASGVARVFGPGDLVLRSKVRVAGGAGGGFALGVDLTLPTGREENLLGAGRAGVRLLAIASAESRRTAVHVNGLAARGGLSNEEGLGAALTLAASPRLTFTAEILMRRLERLRAVEPVAAPHPTIAGVETIRLLPGTSPALVSTAVVGAKWNVADGWLLAVQAAWPMTRRGLTAAVTPAVGLEHTFP